MALLRDGDAYFPALLKAIAGAREEVFLESYLYASDAIGRRVTAALIWAARRGAQVHLLLDGYGARGLPPAMRRALDRAGVRLLFYRPDLKRFAVKRHRLRRLHRKLAVIDGRIGFVGGINIIDDLDHPAQQRPRYDYALQIEGPVVHDLRRVAAAQWRSTCRRQLRRDWLRIGRGRPLPLAVAGVSAALALRDNVRNRRAIEAAYRQAIDEAEEEVLIANAYFLPGARFRRHLVAAAKRDVRVVLLLQGQMEVPLVQYATRVLYRSLLRSGIEIYEYRDGFMHAKVAVVDGRWLTVGSSNIEPLSLLAALEANVMVQDEGLAGQLRDDLLLQIDRYADRVTPEAVGSIPWWRRIMPWIAYQLVRVLQGMTGLGGRYYLE